MKLPASLAPAITLLLSYIALPTTGTIISSQQATPSQQDAFLNPPVRYRPKFRYWLPDASVDPDVVAADITSIVEKGGGGVEFLPFYFYGYVQSQGVNEGRPPPSDWSEFGFGTGAFGSVLNAALNATNKAGGVMDFALGPNQGAGVPAESGSVGLSVELLMGNVTVGAGQSYQGEVPAPQPALDALTGGLGFQQPLLPYGIPNLTAVIAMEVLDVSTENVSLSGTEIPLKTTMLNVSSFIDLTATAQGGQLKWSAPAGNSTWRIMSFWEKYTNQKECAGGVNPTNFVQNGSWIVDHFSSSGAKVVTDFWDQYILNDTDISQLMRSVGEYVWEDSIEMVASLYWTPDFLQRFEQNRGYSALPYLPLFFNMSNSWNGILPTYLEQYRYGNYTPDGNSVHNLDFRTTLNDGYQEYIQYFEQWAHSIGVQYSDQPAYNLPLEMFADISLLDAPEGESLGFDDSIDAYRQFTGPAHLSGRNVISSEVGAVNQAPYSLTLPALLTHIQRNLAGGFTQSVIHGSPYSSDYPNTTWPGYTTFFYNYTDMWNSIQPAWTHMKDSLDYVARNQYILQQGVPKIDLAFYLYASPWEPDQRYYPTNLEGLGFTYNYLGPENLNSSQAVVKDGILAPNGPAFKALIFSNQTTITTAAVQKLTQFANEGFPVIFIGQPPNQVLSGRNQDQTQLEAALSGLMAAKNIHRIQSASELPATLAKLHVTPRVALNCSSPSVYSAFRSAPANSTDYVYLWNDRNTSSTCQATMTVENGTVPYLYDAWTGVQSAYLTYVRASGVIMTNFTLQSNESILLALPYGDTASTAAPSCSINSLTSANNLSSVTFNTSTSQIVANLLGPTTIQLSSGKTQSYTNITPPAPSQLRIFNLTLDSWHSPPNRFNVTSAITTYNFPNQPLIPWSQLAANFTSISGIGRYTTTIPLPTPSNTSNSNPLTALLSLGPIQSTIRVLINSQPLPAINLNNAVVDITPYLPSTGASEFELEIEVTTPLFNTIKASQEDVMVYGYNAGRNGLFDEVEYLENGLRGPVEIRWGVGVVVGC